MAWTEWKRTDTHGPEDYEVYQWQRRNGDLFEMYQVVPYPDYTEYKGYYVGGGLFHISDWDEAEADWARKNHMLATDCPDEALAKALFENCFADWDLESADTYEEAQAWVNERVLGRE